MGGRPPPTEHSAAVAHMVVSVGPYKLKNLRPGAQRSTTSAGHASPATVITRRVGKSSSTIAASAEGGSVTIVTAASRSTLAKFGPGNNDEDRARHSVPPARMAITISKIDASKLSDANCSTRSSATSPK